MAFCESLFFKLETRRLVDFATYLNGKLSLAKGRPKLIAAKIYDGHKFISNKSRTILTNKNTNQNKNTKKLKNQT